MGEAFGFIEVKSLARGFGLVDDALKKAHVQIYSAQILCAGKYLLVYFGKPDVVWEVNNYLLEKAVPYTIDHAVIEHLSEDVLPAITRSSEMNLTQGMALGLIDTHTCVSALLAADTITKAEPVSILDIGLARAMAGRSYVSITGDISAVKQGLDKGVKLVKERGFYAYSRFISGVNGNMRDVLA